MKFFVYVCKSYYENEHEIKRLEKLGFVFGDVDEGGERSIDGTPTISINGIAQLMKFISEYGDVSIDQYHNITIDNN